MIVQVIKTITYEVKFSEDLDEVLAKSRAIRRCQEHGEAYLDDVDWKAEVV